MDMMPEAPESSGLINNVAGAVGALAVKLGSVLKVGRGGLQRRIKAGTGRGKISEAQELQELLDFKYVVLDEAGAMLEPDMVCTTSHNCSTVQHHIGHLECMFQLQFSSSLCFHSPSAAHVHRILFLDDAFCHNYRTILRSCTVPMF